jgi:hypothetical protein
MAGSGILLPAIFLSLIERHLEQGVILREHSSPLHFRYISPFIVLLIIRTLSKFR